MEVVLLERARSPIAVKEVLKVGEELEAGTANIREIVIFSEQAELTGDEDSDKAEEYRTWTVEGIQNIRKVFKQGLKEWEKLHVEQKALRGKKSKKVIRLRRKVARLRLEIAQEIGRLNIGRARQRLIGSIRSVQKEVRDSEREIESFTEKLNRKRIKIDDRGIQASRFRCENAWCRSKSTTTSLPSRSGDRYSRSLSVSSRLDRRSVN
jgi:hypothetical protein